VSVDGYSEESAKEGIAESSSVHVGLHGDEVCHTQQSRIDASRAFNLECCDDAISLSHGLAKESFGKRTRPTALAIFMQLQLSL
jgi:hypothetical protein